MSSVITLKHKGDFSKTDKFFEKVKHIAGNNSIFDKYGKMGLEELKSRTPIDTGKTANSWYYKVENNKRGTVITWCNSNINDGVNIAIILQYGHGTGWGAYVEGTDYINPSVERAFKALASSLWEEMRNA